MSSTSVTTPTSRWPCSLPTDGPPRLPLLRMHHPRLRLRRAAPFSRLTICLADKRRIIFQLSSIISVLKSSSLQLVGDTADHQLQRKATVSIRSSFCSSRTSSSISRDVRASY